MDSMLFDELLEEIFTRVPSSSPFSPPTSSSSSSSSTISLVSKRWLNVLRASKTSLSLRLLPENRILISLPSILSHYPFLTSLSLHISSSETPLSDPTTSFDNLLYLISSSCSNLKNLRFLAGPVSVPALFSLSKSCQNLNSLTISLSRPLSFTWVSSFPFLKDLSVYISGVDSLIFDFYFQTEEFDAELCLESLCLSGIRSDDSGFGWLWRSCKRLRKLQLKSCSGIGDVSSISSFVNCLKRLEEIELRTCRTIVDSVLIRLAENSDSLKSLLLYDGGSTDGLLHFINHSRCNLQKLDLRLPLDLTNTHLSALAVNFTSVSSLKLQSCCLVTGDGLRTISVAMSSRLEELSLINCDVVERETGLLATLGQNLKKLKKLDLSYNDMLNDMELTAILVSCTSLIELKLRGCRKLSGFTMVYMSKNCKQLEIVDIVNCCGIDSEAVETFVVNSPRLRRLVIEEDRICSMAKS